MRECGADDFGRFVDISGNGDVVWKEVTSNGVTLKKPYGKTGVYLHLISLLRAEIEGASFEVDMDIELEAPDSNLQLVNRPK